MNIIKIKNVKFLNPCKFCLCRPACKKECDKFDFYKNTTFGTCFTIYIICCIFLEWFTIFKIFQYSNTLFRVIILGIIIYIYIKSILEIIEYADFKNHHWPLQILFILIDHTGEFFTKILENLKLDTLMEMFQYRFIKHLRKD